MRDRKTASGRALDKIAFVIGLSGLAALLIFAIGFYSGLKRNFVYDAVLAFRNMVVSTEDGLEQAALSRPIHFLQTARHDGDGVTVNAAARQDDLILLSGFFDDSNGLRLIGRDGRIVASWDVAFSDIFTADDTTNDPNGDWNVDLHGALAMPDGAVVFNFEYFGTVKLSRCGVVEWKVPLRTHHSIISAEAGGFWVPGRKVYRDPGADRFPPFSATGSTGAISADEIVRLSESGEVLLRKSVPDILYENRLGALLTANGQVIDAGYRLDDGGEMVHLNKIAELTSDRVAAFPMFESGDLLLSLRTHNLLMVVDPDDWRVKWHQTGPWQRQHDPEFDRSGRISVFNNNAYGYQAPDGERADPVHPASSNIMTVVPGHTEAQIVYGDRPGQEFGTIVRGAQEATPGGGRIITEFDAGRVFEVDPDGALIWEYVNRYDAENVAELTGAIVYPAEYFKVSDWSCP